jgi:hypothetical protein
MTINDTIFNTNFHEYDISKVQVNSTQTLKWNRQLGIGFLNPPENSHEVYDENYWQRYREMADTRIGKDLTAARIEIAKHFDVKPVELLDVGVGNADFCDKFGCYGFDINPEAVKYLKSKRKYTNPYEDRYKWKAMSMWDVIEHITDATEILSKTNMLLMSTPIYHDMEHCLSSKHFRTDEHFWYFTVSGMIHYMNFFGFDCKYYSTIESKLGREDIGSFVFVRV